MPLRPGDEHDISWEPRHGIGPTSTFRRFLDHEPTDAELGEWTSDVTVHEDSDHHYFPPKVESLPDGSWSLTIVGYCDTDYVNHLQEMTPDPLEG